MAKKRLSLTPGLYPAPLTLVSCADKKGRGNIITIAWIGVVSSDPPALGIGVQPTRFSYNLIKETGDFVVNVPGEGLLKKADGCGLTSGKDIDKFSHFGLTARRADKVKSPLIAECPVNIECKVKKVIELGMHHLFIGEVVAVQADEKVVTPSGKIDFTKVHPVVYNQGEYWNLRERVGSHGFSARR